MGKFEEDILKAKEDRKNTIFKSFDHMNHKYIRKEGGKYIYEENKEKQHTEKYKALHFSQSDPNLGDIEFKILPINNGKHFLVQKTLWKPKREDGTQNIVTGSKQFDISEYNNVVEKFRKTGAKEKEL